MNSTQQEWTQSGDVWERGEVIRKVIEAVRVGPLKRLYVQWESPNSTHRRGGCWEHEWLAWQNRAILLHRDGKAVSQ